MYKLILTENSLEFNLEEVILNGLKAFVFKLYTVILSVGYTYSYAVAKVSVAKLN